MRRIQIDLADVGDVAHQRAGEAAAHAAAAPPRVSEMYWPIGEATTISPAFSPVSRSITAPCPAKIPRVGKVAAVVKPALRAVSMRRSVGCNLVGDLEPTGGLRTVFGAARGSGGGLRSGCGGGGGVAVVAAASAASGGCGGRSGARAGLSPGAQGIDQAGVDREAFAFDQHGVGGNRDVLADGLNQSIANHHRALGDDGAGDGHDLRVVDGHCRMGLGKGQSATQE